MLPSSQRVSRSVFPTIATGRNAHSGLLSLRYVLKCGPRFSFVISKKVAPSAAKRNLLKRRGSAIVQKLMPELTKPVTGVFYFKKGAAQASFTEIKSDIEAVLRESRALQ